MALREIASLCDRGKNAFAAPAAAVQPPLVFSTTMEASDKAKLPASVVKFKDGTFMTTPCQKAATFGAAGPKLFGSADGTLVPPTKEINLSGIAAIALGCLSDIDKESFAAPAGPLEFGGLPTRLYPVVGTPFEQLRVVQQGAPAFDKPIEEALKLSGVAFRPWGVAPPAVFAPASGLPDLPAARAAKFTVADLVGASAPMREATVRAVGLVDASDESTAETIAAWLAGINGSSTSADSLAVALATLKAAAGSAPPPVFVEARQMGNALLVAFAAIMDAIDAQCVAWVAARVADMATAGVTASVAQRGALMARAPAEVAKEAAAEAARRAAAAPAVGSAATAITAGGTIDVSAFAAQVAAILRQSGSPAAPLTFSA